MKRRYLYALMYAVPTLLLSAIFMVVVTGAVAGALWLFVYGDDPWPSFVDRYAPMFMLTVLMSVWLTLLSAAFAWGKRQESEASFNMKTIYFSAGSTAALVLVVFLHQQGVGNIGREPDVIVCGDFCTANQFSTSRFPQDGTCRCYGPSGSEALNISMSRVRSK